MMRDGFVPPTRNLESVDERCGALDRGNALLPPALHLAAQALDTIQQAAADLAPELAEVSAR